MFKLRSALLQHPLAQPQPVSHGRLCDAQQLFQLRMFPGAQQLYRISAVRLHRVENVGSPLWAVTAVAIVKRVAVVIEREHPAIGLDCHQTAVDFSPRLLT